MSLLLLHTEKLELYAGISQMHCNADYGVKIFKMVNLEYGDYWNCRSDLNVDTLMGNVIIGNISSGEGEYFWNNGE